MSATTFVTERILAIIQSTARKLVTISFGIPSVERMMAREMMPASGTPAMPRLVRTQTYAMLI